MAAWGKHSNNPQSVQPTPPEYVNAHGDRVDPPPELQDVVRPLTKQSNVLPYRGQEYHGVNPNLAGDPPEINTHVFDQTAVVPEGQKPPERAEVPVPVRVVKGEEDWEENLFRTTGMILSDNSITLVGHMRNRTNCEITNNGDADIYVSADQQPMQPNSYLIAPGQKFTTRGRNRIYGVSVDGSDQPVSILEEYYISAERKPTY